MIKCVLHKSGRGEVLGGKLTKIVSMLMVLAGVVSLSACRYDSDFNLSSMCQSERSVEAKTNAGVRKSVSDLVLQICLAKNMVEGSRIKNDSDDIDSLRLRLYDHTIKAIRFLENLDLQDYDSKTGTPQSANAKQSGHEWVVQDFPQSVNGQQSNNFRQPNGGGNAASEIQMFADDIKQRIDELNNGIKKSADS